MKRAALLVAGLALAIGLVVARPLPAELTRGLPVGSRQLAELPVLARTAGDTLQLYYQLWLVQDGLLGPTPLFQDPYQFRVDGPRWNLPQAFLPLALPFTVLSPLGLHAAYNLLVLLSFPAAALAAYGLARRCTADPRAALVAALGFSVLPVRLDALFGGHPAGFAMALVPAVVWGLDAALAGGRWGGALGGGLALLALAMLEPQYTYLVAGFAAPYVVARAATAPPDRAPWALVAFGLLAAAAVGWVFMLRHTFVTGSVAEAGRPLAEVRLFSPGPGELANPATFGGLAMAGLALVGLGAGRDRARLGLRLVFGAAFVLGVVLSLGPAVPGVPLYQALHRWLPFFAMIRNPAKFHVLTGLGVLVLAALGARALLSRLDRHGRRTGDLAAAGLAAAVLVMTAPWHGIAVARFRDSPVYETLRQEATRVLYLPVWPGDSAYSSVYLYSVTRTRVPAVNGYSAFVPRRYVHEIFEPLEPMNVGDLDGEATAALSRLGVSHVVVDRAVFPPQVSPYPSAFTIGRLQASPALALIAAADPLWLFRVTGEAPGGRVPRPTSAVGLFHEAEWQSRQTGTVAPAPEASGGRAVLARPGADAAGYLAFGPYRPLPAGSYVARFRVRGAGLHLDVATDQGQRILAERTLDAGSASWTDVVLPFTVERARPLEFRVAWDGRSEAAADWVLVVAADRPEPEWTYEVEQLPHRLVGERPDPEASGGWAGYADPAESLRAPLVTGPARLFPAGRYRLALRLRATAPARGPLVRLAVTTPAGPELAGRTVDAAEVLPGAYREVTLDFALGQSLVLEFPVAYLGDVEVLFDRVTVEPR